jgi:hypothetical protein
MFAIIVSILNIASISAACHAVRVVIRRVLSGLPRLLVEEGVSTLEFCGVCFELAFVCDNYGKTLYAIGLYVMCLWWGLHWGDAAVNPNKYLEDIVRGNTEPKQAGYVIGVEAVTGLAVWRIIRVVWAMGYSELHMAKSQEVICQADLQVSVIKGAAVECILSFIDRLNALSQEHYTWQYTNVLNAILSTGLVVAALDYSGGYFNPVLAMSLKMGCKGHNLLEHVIVYWVASAAGSMIALQLYRVGVRTLGLKKAQPEEGAEAEINGKKIN